MLIMRNTDELTPAAKRIWNAADQSGDGEGEMERESLLTVDRI